MKQTWEGLPHEPEDIADFVAFAIGLMTQIGIATGDSHRRKTINEDWLTDAVTKHSTAMQACLKDLRAWTKPTSAFGVGPRRPLQSTATVALVVAALTCVCTPVAAGILREDFARDPGWTIYNLRQPPSTWPTRHQDFGWSNAPFPGAATPGMIGGWIERSTTPAVYARPMPERSLNDRLHASGVFRVPRAHGSSGALLGWFHETSRGWRTPNSLVLRVDGNGPTFWVFFEYGTQHRLTGGKGCFEGEAYQTTPTKPFPADGAVHRWSLEYDPTGAEGNGLITFVLDGQPWTLPLQPGHKADGAVFNRFGLFNQQLTGDGLEVWFADLQIDGERLDLSPEPKWESRGNRTNFTDRVLRPFNDAGWRNTSRAGGEPGELGGLFWRDEPPWFLATPIGQLSLNQELSASGRIVMTGAAVDSAIYFGWFEAEAKTNRTPAEYRTQPRNQLALLIEGPSRVGHYVRPVCSDRTGAGFRQDSGPVILPDGKPHEWSLRYAPSGAGGRGEITWRFDGQKQMVPLPEGLRQRGARFDHFGFFNFQPDGAWLEMYVDDLQFTVGEATVRADEPASGRCYGRPD